MEGRGLNIDKCIVFDLMTYALNFFVMIYDLSTFGVLV
jgi:hypothetical protein